MYNVHQTISKHLSLTNPPPKTNTNSAKKCHLQQETCLTILLLRFHVDF